jgi:hypothetical protein
VLRTLGVFSFAAVVPPIVAFALLWSAMPAHEALRSVLGSWVYAFDPQISAMKFYRDMRGTSDAPTHLLWILGTAMLYLTALVPVLLVATFTRRKSATWIMFVAASVVAVVLYAAVDPQWWQGIFRGLTLAMPLNVIVLLARWWKRRRAPAPDACLIMQPVV